MRFWKKRNKTGRISGRVSRGGPSWKESPEFFLVLSLIFIMVIGSTVLTNRFATYKRKANSVIRQRELLLDAERQADDLRRREELLESPQAQEKLLREKMDYARDDEIIFEFEPIRSDSAQ